MGLHCNVAISGHCSLGFFGSVVHEMLPFLCIYLSFIQLQLCHVLYIWWGGGGRSIVAVLLEYNIDVVIVSMGVCIGSTAVTFAW